MALMQMFWTCYRRLLAHYLTSNEHCFYMMLQFCPNKIASICGLTCYNPHKQVQEGRETQASVLKQLERYNKQQNQINCAFLSALIKCNPPNQNFTMPPQSFINRKLIDNCIIKLITRQLIKLNSTKNIRQFAIVS